MERNAIWCGKAQNSVFSVCVSNFNDNTLAHSSREPKNKKINIS